MYWLDPTQSSTNSLKVFFADTESDIRALPTSRSPGEKQKQINPDITMEEWKPCFIGSQCLIINTGDVWMLNSQDIWEKIGG